MPAIPRRLMQASGLAAALTGFAALTMPGEANAFFWSRHTSPRACAPHADRMDVPGLWLGHFSGGRWARHENGGKRVDWRNEYQCFFSARACHAWRAGMKRQFARFEGYGTCIALRGGGRPYGHGGGPIASRF